MRRTFALFTLALFSLSLFAQGRLNRWIAVLEEPPVAAKVKDRSLLKSPAASNARQAIDLQQGSLRRNLEASKIRVLGSSQLLLNAVYFAGSADQAARVREMPGVVQVVKMRAYRRAADDAFPQIMNAPQAWNALGGVNEAGNGRRIGILDSGIDHSHPSFQDGGLSPPAGFPKANTDSDLAFTNSKVIVARSYVDMLVFGDDPSISRPDDTSARDRVGHGTAVASIAAGRQMTGPAGTIIGIAPKAFLGNYKIFGSPGVNDLTFTDTLIRALEDAAVDGMDVVTLSLGSPAQWGPLDRCTNPDRFCDPLAEAVDGLMNELGVAVVVAAGNSGNDGFNFPALGSIESPGTAPSAITVGAITNGNIYNQSIQVQGSSTRISALFGNGPLGSVRARGRDVGQVGTDGRACRPLGNDTLTGRIAFIDRGDCTLETKVNNAQRAGAVGVVIVQFDGTNSLFRMEGLQNTGIPAVLVGNSDGQALKNQVRANPDLEITLDPAFTQSSGRANEIAVTSSQGPSMFSLDRNDTRIKPELTAVGTDVYSATQRYDPNGTEYSADGYISLHGTSVAVPMVAGAIALVKQRHSNWSPIQVKSAVTNTANQEVTDFDSNGQPFRARVNSTGAGKLDVGQAVNTTITADPATISFGVVSNAGVARDLRLTNTSNSPIAVSLSVQPRDTDNNATVTIDGSTSFQLLAGQTTQISVRISGARPNPGSYEGVIVVNGGAVTLRVPYLYLVGDGVPYNIYALGNDFLSTPNAPFDVNDNPLLVKVLDRYGVPVQGARVQWSSVAGGGRIDTASEQTDSLGVADAGVTTGPELGEQAFRVNVAGLSQDIFIQTILQPTIRSGGIVNAAGGQVGRGLAPGSYISIFGSGLSQIMQTFRTPYLPVSLAGVSVSFDAPGQRISAPGRLHFVSDGQINVQIPWEMRNITTARMKVSIGLLSSAVFDVPLNEFSPGIFEYNDASSGRLLAAALNETNQVISGSNPVSRGRVAQLFVNGLGRVSNQPASGEPAPLQPLSQTMATPEVQIGGRPASVQFSGLAPGNIGLYQVNVVVPSDAPEGIQPLTISIGGVTSQTSQIAVR